MLSRISAPASAEHGRNQRPRHSAVARRRSGADQGRRPAGAPHRGRRLVRRRISRDLAGLRGRALSVAEIDGGGDARGARPPARRSRRDPWRLAVSARSARPRAKAEMVSPAPGRRQQSLARRSLGQRCRGDDLARRRQHARDGGVCDRRSAVFCERARPRHHRPRRRQLRPSRLSPALDRRQDRLRRRRRRHRARCRQALCRARHAGRRHPPHSAASRRAVAAGLQRISRGRGA